MQTQTLPPPATVAPTLDHLRMLEAESIHIMREVVAEFERPVMLYSIGKDSSVLLRLAQKAFYPGPIPFPLLHIDTTYKFREMIAFRDWYAAEIGAKLIVHTNTAAIADGAQPFALGTQRCCGLLKTQALLDATRGRRIRRGVRRRAARRGAVARQGARLLPAQREGPMGSEAAAAGAVAPAERPDLPGRERSASSRSRTGPSSTCGTTSTSEQIPVVPLYFAKPREVIVRGERLIMREQPFVPLLPGEKAEVVMCRMRSLGCSPCTGAVRSDADTVPKIIEELVSVRHSERQLRVIDHDQDSSMEMKKREGYF